MSLLEKIIITAPPLLIAVILHEIAHGYVAKRLGDPTASDAGRLTLNPLKHIDPFWTILLPTMLIVSGSPVVLGGAKPVPVDPRYFNRPRKGMMWVAVAGPATNFILAAISFLLYQSLVWGVHTFNNVLVASALATGGITTYVVTVLAQWFQAGVFINVILALFNLIPVPPLDGGRIVTGLLPWEMAKKYMRIEKWGIVIVFALLYFGVIDVIFRPIYDGVLKLMGY